VTTTTTTTTATAATSVTASASATTALSKCRSRLNQADRCQCEQGYNRFSHYAFPPLEEGRSLAYNTFASGLFDDQTAFAAK
jgi:hypothetical protein